MRKIKLFNFEKNIKLIVLILILSFNIKFFTMDFIKKNNIKSIINEKQKIENKHKNIIDFLVFNDVDIFLNFVFELSFVVSLKDLGKSNFVTLVTSDILEFFLKRNNWFGDIFKSLIDNYKMQTLPEQLFTNFNYNEGYNLHKIKNQFVDIYEAYNKINNKKIIFNDKIFEEYYDIKKVNNKYFLLLPKDYKFKDYFYKLESIKEINEKSFENNILYKEEEIIFNEKEIIFGGKIFLKENYLLKAFETILNDTNKNNYFYNIFLNGHGLPDETVAVTNKEFVEILKFFKKDLPTLKNLVLNSCFPSGKKIIDTYYKNLDKTKVINKYNNLFLELLPFNIVNIGIIYEETKAVFNDYISYNNFFYYLNENKFFQALNSVLSYTEKLKSKKSEEIKDSVNNYFLIKPANASFFTVFNKYLPKEIIAIGAVDNKKAQLQLSIEKIVDNKKEIEFNKQFNNPFLGKIDYNFENIGVIDLTKKDIKAILLKDVNLDTITLKLYIKKDPYIPFFFAIDYSEKDYRIKEVILYFEAEAVFNYFIKSLECQEELRINKKDYFYKDFIFLNKMSISNNNFIYGKDEEIHVLISSKLVLKNINDDTKEVVFNNVKIN